MTFYEAHKELTETINEFKQALLESCVGKACMAFLDFLNKVAIKLWRH